MLKNKSNFEIINSFFSLLGRELFRRPSYVRKTDLNFFLQITKTCTRTFVSGFITWFWPIFNLLQWFSFYTYVALNIASRFNGQMNPVFCTYTKYIPIKHWLTVVRSDTSMCDSPPTVHVVSFTNCTLVPLREN